LDYIEVKDITTHNLKGFDLKIPLNCLVVITGPSGSGKSSLAINTILAEAKKELSQVLFQKPAQTQIGAKFVNPLPPAIGLSQEFVQRFSYSAVGDILSIFKFLQILYLEKGEYFCTNCGKHNPVNSLQSVLLWYKSLSEGKKFYFLLPLMEKSPKALDYLLSQGYTKYFIAGKEYDISEERIPEKELRKNQVFLILDRMITGKRSFERLLENIRMSMGINRGRVVLYFPEEGREYRMNFGETCVYCGAVLNIKKTFCERCRGHGYIEKKECPSCRGLKFSTAFLKSKVFGVEIESVLRMSLKEFKEFLKSLNRADLKEFKPYVEKEIKRLELAEYLGLGELKLVEPVFRLSTGEKRLLEIFLILSINLKGCIYVFDEPSTGLDFERRKKLLFLLREVLKKGNSVMLIEHDPYLISNADFLIELGPEGGRKGGYLLNSDFLKSEESFSLKFRIKKVKKRKDFIKCVVDGREIRILKKGITLVRGKEGRVAEEFFYRIQESLKEKGFSCAVSEVRRMKEDELVINAVEVWKELRDFLVQLPQAKIKGLTRRHLSFGTKEGVCPGCKGKGKKVFKERGISVEMLCEECMGKKLNPEVLALEYRGFRVGDIFELTVQEAISLFENLRGIREKLLFLKKLGLGYLTLGQEVGSLSGGERARLGIAKRFFQKGRVDFLFLEYPCRGLHLKDLENFLDWLNWVNERAGVVMIESNSFALFLSDWIINVDEDLIEGNLEKLREYFKEEVEYYERFAEILEF